MFIVHSQAIALACRPSAHEVITEIDDGKNLYIRAFSAAAPAGCESAVNWTFPMDDSRPSDMDSAFLDEQEMNRGAQIYTSAQMRTSVITNPGAENSTCYPRGAIWSSMSSIKNSRSSISASSSNNFTSVSDTTVESLTSDSTWAASIGPFSLKIFPRIT